jgi:tRNA threonylcarbamoyladenosine biosynthesis protein TsaB
MSGPGRALVLEASTYRGTVALIVDDAVRASEQVAMRGMHEERLMPAVAHVLAAAGTSIDALDRVVCGAGPGSFTSLRIAAAIAKGLATGRESAGSGVGRHATPHGPRLACVSSLVLIVASGVEQLESGAYIAALDALRGDRYGMLVSVVRDVRKEGGANDGRVRVDGSGGWRRLSVADLERWADETGATIVGPGYDRDVWPDAAGARWVREWIEDVDPVSWEPEYGRLAEAEVRRAAAQQAISE